MRPAEDSTVIFGTVSDEEMGDHLRVTVVATGLGRAGKKQPTSFTVVKSGTDHAPLGYAAGNGATSMSGALAHGASGASSAPAGPGHDYAHLDTPAVWRSRDNAAARVAALEDAGTDRMDIPAFLRKQAD